MNHNDKEWYQQGVCERAANKYNSLMRLYEDHSEKIKGLIETGGGWDSFFPAITDAQKVWFQLKAVAYILDKPCPPGIFDNQDLFPVLMK